MNTDKSVYLYMNYYTSTLSITLWTVAKASAEQEERYIDYLSVAHVGTAASADWGQGKSK